MQTYAAEIIAWVMAVIAVEAATEIFVGSEIMFPVRDLMVRTAVRTRPGLGTFVAGLVSCGYCSSVWVSASVAWLLPGSLCYNRSGMAFVVIDIIAKIFVLHRLANFSHGIINTVCHHPPRRIVLTVKQDNSEDSHD
jgi:hypothetical protein